MTNNPQYGLEARLRQGDGAKYAKVLAKIRETIASVGILDEDTFYDVVDMYLAQRRAPASGCEDDQPHLTIFHVSHDNNVDYVEAAVWRQKPELKQKDYYGRNHLTWKQGDTPLDTEANTGLLVARARIYKELPFDSTRPRTNPMKDLRRRVGANMGLDPLDFTELHGSCSGYKNPCQGIEVYKIL